MPISSGLFEDEFVWNYEKYGNYTVKSGYQFINFYRNNLEGAIGSSSEPVIWKKIWRLAVPPKVCVFIWRIRSGALPTNEGFCIGGWRVCLLSVKDVLMVLSHPCTQCGNAMLLKVYGRSVGWRR